MDALTTGELAKRAGVGVETIRFYEREGLIQKPPRRRSGYRQYPEETIRRVQFIRRAKDLGFTLQEVAELLSLRVAQRASTCARVRERAAAKIADVEGKISDLERIRGALGQLVRACTGRGRAGACSILEALDQTGPRA